MPNLIVRILAVLAVIALCIIPFLLDQGSLLWDVDGWQTNLYFVVMGVLLIIASVKPKTKKPS